MTHRAATPARASRVAGALLLAGVLSASAGAGAGTAATSGAAAPWSGQQGFSAGLHLASRVLPATATTPTDDTPRLPFEEQGGGVQAFVGYTFTDEVHLRFTVGGTGHTTDVPDVIVAVGGVGTELHYRFLPGERVRPMLLGGIGVSVVNVTDADRDSNTVGPTATLGFGVTIHLGEHIALEGMSRLDLINWDRVEVTRAPGTPGSAGGTEDVVIPIEDSGAAANLLIGASWQF